MFHLILPLLLAASDPAPVPPSAEAPSVRKFPVSAVELAKDPLETVPAAGYLRGLAGKDFEAGGKLAGADMVDLKRLSKLSAAANGIPNAFVQAAHLSFAEHRPLVLSPDMVWLLINQAAARKVLADPEAVRKVLVKHSGVESLTVRRDEFKLGDAGNDWPGVFAEFEKQIAEKSPSPDLVRDFAHPFSRSTPDTLAARRVTLMKAMSAYYRFEVATLCGIPEIRLEGTPEDWRWIRLHAEDLKALKMEAHIAAWRPVLDQFVAASEGKVDAAFWQSLYKYEDASGGDVITGWIQVFLEDDVRRLEALAKPGFLWMEEQIGAHGRRQPPALAVAEIPRGDVMQIFTWAYLGQNKPMMFRAGFLGVSQDSASKALRPEVSWLVRHAAQPMAKVDFHEFLEGIGSLNWRDIDQLKTMWAQSEGRIPVPYSKAALANVFEGNRRFQDEVLPRLINLKSLGAYDHRHMHFFGDLTVEDAKILVKLPKLKVLKVDGRRVAPECEAILRGRKDWELKIGGANGRFPCEDDSE